MVQDTSDDFDWTRLATSTPTPSTGPSGGADGTRWYIFIEASSPVQANDVARYVINTSDREHLNFLVFPLKKFRD